MDTSIAGESVIRRIFVYVRIGLGLGLGLGAGLGTVGCEDAQVSSLGAAEPFRVRGAQFIEGALPGDSPLPQEDGGSKTSPAVTALELSNIVVRQGQGNKKIAGRATPDTWAVALQLADVGTGYWVFPTGTIDPATGELIWEAICDFDPSIPSAFHDLHVVALTANGTPSRQLSQAICVADSVPDNLNSCDPNAVPPHAVISLRWDTNVDLDLQVLTPDGRWVDSKHPSTLPAVDGGQVPLESGTIDRDSNASCVIDNTRQENLVWQATAPKGTYKVYANLYDACKQASVRFESSVYSIENREDGGVFLKKWHSKSGELLDMQANGGSAHGLFLYEFYFQ